MRQSKGIEGNGVLFQVWPLSNKGFQLKALLMLHQGTNMYQPVFTQED
jgi:hypothetical protein